MKTIRELKQDFSAVKDRRITRAEKIRLVEKIRKDISEVERKALADFSSPLEEIREMIVFLAVVEDYLQRK